MRNDVTSALMACVCAGRDAAAAIMCIT
jgi:hypothetical protein